ncbi:MAG: CDP-alcohol phosphatidyltransferase family protein [Planctomycetota bacterium]|nr:CDP-alcohol phosphatidyltransferase family protein [Planctomycetota bacterium]
MADVSEVEVGGGDVAAEGRPKVVVIVAPRERVAAVQAPAAPLAPAPSPFERDVGDPGDQPTDVSAPRPVALPPAEGDRPTERIRKAPARPRTAEDDRIVAAVVTLDLHATPGPTTDLFGRTLLFRAARAALAAGAPRLLLLGQVPEARHRDLYEEAYRGFGGGPVEVRSGDPGVADFGPGRVLILDGAALHDPEAVKRLTAVTGPSAALLLTRRGDGVRVHTEDGRVRDVGVDSASADGVTAGAASVPVEHFERITQVGERAALEELCAQDRLIGVMARRSYAQQLHSPQALALARVAAYEPIASGGGASGLFEDVIGRPVSRAITALILRRPFFTPSLISSVAGVLALVGAFLLFFSGELPPAYAGLAIVLAGAFLVGSAVLDRTDGELARLRMDEDEAARSLDFGLDHVAHMVVFGALAWAVDPPDLPRRATAWGRFLEAAPSWLLEPLRRWELDDPMRVGFVAIAGVVLLLGVLLWRGAPRADSTGLRRVADGLASAFNSRDYFYLLTIAALFNLVPLLAAKGLMAWFLVATAALVHLTWLAIFVLSVVSPAPPED